MKPFFFQVLLCVASVILIGRMLVAQNPSDEMAEIEIYVTDAELKPLDDVRISTYPLSVMVDPTSRPKFNAHDMKYRLRIKKGAGSFSLVFSCPRLGPQNYTDFKQMGRSSQSVHKVLTGGAVATALQTMELSAVIRAYDMMYRSKESTSEIREQCLQVLTSKEMFYTLSEMRSQIIVSKEIDSSTKELLEKEVRQAENILSRLRDR